MAHAPGITGRRIAPLISSAAGHTAGGCALPGRRKRREKSPEIRAPAAGTRLCLSLSREIQELEHETAFFTPELVYRHLYHPGPAAAYLSHSSQEDRLRSIKRNYYCLVILEPHFGHFFEKQGIPLVCSTVAPQLGQTQLPPGPLPGLSPPMRPLHLPKPIPLPVPGPSPIGPVPSPVGMSSPLSCGRLENLLVAEPPRFLS